MIVHNVRYYTTQNNGKEVNDTIMKIIDKKNDSKLWTRIKFAFNSDDLIQGNKKEDMIYFYRANNDIYGMGFKYFSGFLYVEYYFRTFRVNGKQILKVQSTLNPVGLLFTAFVFLPTILGLLKDKEIWNFELNLIGGFLIGMCFYVIVFIEYKMNRDSTVQDVVKLLELKPVKLKKAVRNER